MKPETYKLLFTGQHLDLLKDVKFDYVIKIDDSENRLDSIISACLLQFPNDYKGIVLIQGDTGSAFGCALAAFHRHLKIIHLQAGLRSYDLENPYPEQLYRQMISRMANINLAPTELSASNLVKEQNTGQIYVTGNTILDTLIDYKERCEYSNIVLVTMHRRQNHKTMKQWFNQINDLAGKYKSLRFIIPIHPNPNVYNLKYLLTNLEVTESLSHNEFLELLSKCRLAISDSGGVQQQGSFFNKKVIVCRTTTERPEALQTGHLYLCKEPSKLKELFDSIVNDYLIDSQCPYGDGHSAQKIINILEGINEQIYLKSKRMNHDRIS